MKVGDLVTIKGPGDEIGLIVKINFEERHPDVRIEVLLSDNVIGTGKGKSKKNAEQMAAKEALLNTKK
mgnify:CR=1 FL=1